MSGADGLVLVSGGAGFVGAALVAALRSAGRRVLAIDLRSNGDSDVIACDLLEPHRLHELVGADRLDAIIHCGAVSGPMLYRDRPAFVAHTNIEGTLNLLELARIGRVRRFVFCSSASVFGARDPDTPVREDSPLHPTSVYAASKIAGEALLEAYVVGHGIEGVSMRIAAVYGPGRRTACVIRDMIVAGMEGRQLIIPFGGNQRYHYVHIEDVVSALSVALGAARLARPAYTIAGDGGVTLGDLARLVRDIAPGPEITVHNAQDPLSDAHGPYDLSAAAAELGWRPVVPLRDGIAGYAEWLALQASSHNTKRNRAAISTERTVSLHRLNVEENVRSH